MFDVLQEQPRVSIFDWSDDLARASQASTAPSWLDVLVGQSVRRYQITGTNGDLAETTNRFFPNVAFRGIETALHRVRAYVLFLYGELYTLRDTTNEQLNAGCPQD